MAAWLETDTKRRTVAACFFAASNTFFVPPTLVVKKSAAVFAFTRPAQWMTASTPSIARSTLAMSSTLPSANSRLDTASSTSRFDERRTSARTTWPSAASASHT